MYIKIVIKKIRNELIRSLFRVWLTFSFLNTSDIISWRWEKLISRHSIIGFPRWEKLDPARDEGNEASYIFSGRNYFLKSSYRAIILYPFFPFISFDLSFDHCDKSKWKEVFFSKFPDNLCDIRGIGFLLVRAHRIFTPDEDIIAMYRRGIKVSLSKLNI